MKLRKFLCRILSRLYSAIYMYVKYMYIELWFHSAYSLIQSTSRTKIIRGVPTFHTNFGDDLNYYLFEKIFNKKVVPFQYSILGRYLLKKKNYLFIGSIILGLSNKNSIIIGAGISPDQPNHRYRNPAAIIALRGRLTYDYLKNIKNINNINCLFGDPALLLPLFYTPQKRKKNKIGIIPHNWDKRYNNVISFIDKCRFAYNVICIDLGNYATIESFIDELCSCDLILSSSLHGLIVADAYDIPNVWVHLEFPCNPFKYLDYFSAVNRMDKTPVSILGMDMSQMEKLKDMWHPISFDKDEYLKYLRKNITFNS